MSTDVQSTILATHSHPFIILFLTLLIYFFQYFGDRISEKVKNKVIEILYSWTVSLPDEAKIAEAYQMLKKQGKHIDALTYYFYY